MYGIINLERILGEKPIFLLFAKKFSDDNNILRDFIAQHIYSGDYLSLWAPKKRSNPYG